jgi:hypothetical protein
MNRETNLAKLERLAAQLESWADQYQDHNIAFDAYLSGVRKPRSDSEIDELVRKLRMR